MYYDKNGKEIGVTEWTRLFADKSYQILAKKNIEDQASVSTVWLGLDHNYALDSSIPVIFETMIFYDEGDETYRYATEKQALAGHDICVYRAWRKVHGLEITNPQNTGM